MRHSCDLELVGIDDATGGAAGDHLDGDVEGLESPGEFPHAVDVFLGRIPEPEDGTPIVAAQIGDDQRLIEPVEGFFQMLSLGGWQIVLLDGAIKRAEQPEPPSRSGALQTSLKADEHGWDL